MGTLPAEVILEQETGYRKDSVLIDDPKEKILQCLSHIQSLLDEILSKPSKIHKVAGPSNSKSDKIQHVGQNDQDMLRMGNQIKHLEAILKSTQNSLGRRTSKGSTSLKKDIHLDNYTCCSEISKESRPPLKRNISLCGHDPTIRVEGMCNQDSVVRASNCSDMSKHNDWLFAKPRILTEGIRVSPEVHWSGFSSELLISAGGISNKPMIELNGVFLRPKITIEGSDVCLNILVNGVLHKPCITVSGLNCKINIFVKGVCIKPCIKYKGLKSRCKIKVDGEIKL